MRRIWQAGTAIALLGVLLLPAAGLSLSPPSPNQLLQAGNAQFQAGNLDAALQFWQQARQQFRQIKNVPGEVQALLRLGGALVSLERYQEAIPILTEGAALAQQLRDAAAAAQLWGNLGIAYQELGSYAKAIATHRQAGKLMRELGDRRGLGQVLTNLGNTFETVGDYSNATIAFQQSLHIAQATGDRIGESVALGNLGALYADQGKDQDAISTFQQSLALAKAIPHLPSQTSALLNLGSAYHSLRQLDQAISYYQASLNLAKTTRDRQREAEALGALGLAYEDQKNFTASIQAHQQSLAIARSLNKPEAEGRALNNLGHTYFQAGNLTTAEAVLRQAIQRLDALRPNLNDNYKVSIFDTQIHTYNLLQQVLVAANQHEAALEAAEWGRARAFAERIRAGIRSRQPARSRAPEHEQQRQEQAADVAPIRIGEIKHIAKQQRATLVEYAIVPDDDFKFRGKQRARAARLFIWVVQPSGQVHFRQVNLKPLWQQELTLTTLVREARACLAPGATCDHLTGLDANEVSGAISVSQIRRRVNPALVRLHQLLIAPIAALLPTNPEARVIVVPQESLFLVPFAALQAADGSFLIEQHTLLTTPAIQVLALTQQIRDRQQTVRAKRDRAFASALVVGNPMMPTINSEQLEPLPNAALEAEEIASLLHTQALIGRQASRQTVVQRMLRAQLVHLATHGLLTYGQQMGETDVPGAIALAPDLMPQSSTVPNGLLTANDILNLQLQAQLVVLSACDTGRGTITGDGVVGLSRAFIAAGVPSVVVSLWAVSDTSTVTLMINFYQNLLQQPDKAKALRIAMLSTMQRHPHPIDWAAFTLIGEAD